MSNLKIGNIKYLVFKFFIINYISKKFQIHHLLCYTNARDMLSIYRIYN